MDVEVFSSQNCCFECEIKRPPEKHIKRSHTFPHVLFIKQRIKGQLLFLNLNPISLSLRPNFAKQHYFLLLSCVFFSKKLICMDRLVQEGRTMEQHRASENTAFD